VGNGHQYIDVLQNRDAGQREGESSKAFQAFVLWRDMGDTRSYPAVARKLSKSRTLIKRWGSKFRWQERLREHLQYQDAERLDSQRKAIEEMNSRHINASILFQDKLLERLKSIDISTLAPRDLVRMYEVAVAVERSARGLNPGTKLAAVEQFEIRRPTGNIVSDAVKALSAVDRDLLRNLTLKHMTILRLESEIEVEEKHCAEVKREESAAEKAIEVAAIPQPASSPKPKGRRTEWITEHPIKMLAPFRG
jgi:hypothetical protein